MNMLTNTKLMQEQMEQNYRKDTEPLFFYVLTFFISVSISASQVSINRVVMQLSFQKHIFFEWFLK